MPLFEKYITECNEEADGLAREGSMMDGGAVAQVRASNAASFRCVVDDGKNAKNTDPKRTKLLWTKGKQRRIERRGLRRQTNTVASDAEEAATSSECQARCEGPEIVGERLPLQAEKTVQNAFGKARYGEESRWRDLGMVQEVLSAVPSGAETDEPLQTRKERQESVRRNLEHNPQTRRRTGTRQKRKRMEN